MMANPAKRWEIERDVESRFGGRPELIRTAVLVGNAVGSLLFFAIRRATMLAFQKPACEFLFAEVEAELDAERKYPAIATRKVRVRHDQGLHLRPCMAIVSAVSQYRAKVTVRKGSQAAEGGSVLELLTLAASHGTELVLSATGVESQEALDAVAGLFASGFQGD